MTAAHSHRLDGLEPDNLLAFLAMLGLLRSLEAVDLGLRPKLSWDIDSPPLRPRLHLAVPMSEHEISEAAARGAYAIASNYALAQSNRKDLNFTHTESRTMLQEAAHAATSSSHGDTNFLASLMTDAAVKDGKDYNSSSIDPTPLCLLFGQGHQHFLERLAGVLQKRSLPTRGKGKATKQLSLAECLFEALFLSWRREDPSTFSFRWDPEDDVRYALMAGDPTDPFYKGGTQHGANCLAVAGMAMLPVVPEVRAGRTRPSIIGGTFSANGFSFAWPIWSIPLSLAAIRSLLCHPDLRSPGQLAYLGIDHVLVSRRISVGKFMNFTRAQTLLA